MADPWSSDPWRREPRAELGGGSTERPPSYLVGSILTTIVCCLPLGVASIVYAAQVGERYDAGDLLGARQASDRARALITWNVLGVLGVVVVAAVIAVVAADPSLS